MLRITQFLREAYLAESPLPTHRAQGYVIIWNLTNRCNLACYHCYANARGGSNHGELSAREAVGVIDDLAAQRVHVLILSGGEPILRHDLHEIARYARQRGLSCALSSNGTLIDERQAEKILHAGIGYVGISIDGTPEIHDGFRGKKGACEAALRAIRLCTEVGIRVGLRFSLTSYTASQLPAVFDLVEREGLSKLYISHLNDSKKAMKHLALEPSETREAMSFTMGKAFEYLQDGSFSPEIVTGNNDADAAYLMSSISRKDPGVADRLCRILRCTKANGDAARLANIDPWGDVHPDPFCRNISLGNVKEAPFGRIMTQSGHSITQWIGSRAGPFRGRCGGCRFLDICQGNSRARAFARSQDGLDSDPLCYLTDQEISRQ